MISRGTIIFFVILATHIFIDQLIPKDWKIFSYFTVTLLPLIVLLICALSTQKPKFATWTLLFLSTTISYALSTVVISTYTTHITQNTTISAMLLSQIITFALYIISKIWMKLTKTLQFNLQILGLLFTTAIVLSIFSILNFFIKVLATNNFAGTLMLFTLVLIFQAANALATEKWDLTAQTQQTSVK